MDLVFNDRRDATTQVELSRGRQAKYHIAFVVQLWYSEEPKLYVQILKRSLYDTSLDGGTISPLGEQVGGDQIAEAILDYQRTGTMIRNAMAKLDGLSFENFIGDWCTEQGGYQVLDIREEKQ